MRYLSILSAPERADGPTDDEITRMDAFLKEELEAGRLVTTDGCMPTANGARVRRYGGAVTVIDGPFTEAKEVIGGFALLEVASKEEAIEVGRRFLEIIGEGTCEIRELYPTPPGPVVEFHAALRRTATTV